MVKFVNAKLNLGLNILRKRSDGYHDLETVFYPVGIFNGTPQNPEPFCDIIEIHLHYPNSEDEFHFSGRKIDCPLEGNLVWKAIKAFRKEMHEKHLQCQSVCVWLDKHLPDGAGLGGGSADASFLILTLNDLFGKPFQKSELITMAETLGADCPFFIENRPVIATGKGEIMKPVSLNMHGYWVLIAKPALYISTKEAFSGVKTTEPDNNIVDIIESLPVEKWDEAGLKNDFEKSLFPRYKELPAIKYILKESGAAYASMSGSGSSLFGIFSSKSSVLEAQERLLKFSPSLQLYPCLL